MKSKRIIIYLHPTSSTQVSWIMVDETSQVTQSVFNGDLSQFPTHTQDDEVIILVPTEQVLLTHVQLPKLPRQRLMQALPFALEEQLIDDVSELHFALGQYQTNTWPVAIVSQKKMAAWLNLCEELNVSPRAFLPSIFMLPYTDKIWTINTDENHCLVRCGPWDGFACEEVNVEMLLDLKLADEPDQQNIQVDRIHVPEKTLLEKAADASPFSNAINLLQGPYQPKLQTTQTKKIWIVTGYLALALVALGFFSQLVSLFILQKQANAIETAINTIYKKNFPNAKAIVAPRERMSEKLRALSGTATHNGLLVLLGQIGKAISEMKSVRITHLEFKDQQMTLEISTPTFASLDKFIALLNQEALVVKQQSAATAGAEVKATISIRQGAVT